MSGRRQFLKGIGVLGALPWARPLLAEGNTPANQEPSGKKQLASNGFEPTADAVVLENAEMRLIIRPDGSAQSLVHKPTGQECVDTKAHVPMFTVTQYRPLDNELQLAYPAKITHFPAGRVRREDDKLIVDFARVGYEGTIGLTITDSYITFRLEELTYKGYTPIRPKHAFPLDETIFLQLPIRPRKNFGDWLNVMWDQDVAVNVLATDPETQIDATPCAGHYLFHAGSVREVKLKDVGAALITTATPHLLDRIARLEEDFALPRGVQSRRSKEIKHSYYQAVEMTPKDVDRQIKYAKMAGLRQMMLITSCFAKGLGHLPWRPEYSRGMADLKEVVGKIRNAQIIPGLHVLHTMVTTGDAYVTPKPDPRLSLAISYTLAGNIDPRSTTIPIEEDPRLSPSNGPLCVLRIGNELIRYGSYTASAPYRFENCQRAIFGTTAAAHEVSSRVGLLNLYSAHDVRLSENTSIQAEVADRIAQIYRQAGFRFMYFDGSEQVPRPYWHTISLAQNIVWKKLEPPPLLAEASCKSHFSWHMISGGNAFDIFAPEEMKAGIRSYPAAEAPRVAKDFTTINFGWIGYVAPSKETIGVQPDMLEYATSVAAGWDCPVSLQRGRGQDLLTALETHPRTPDNLEVIRRWEEIRDKDWLTSSQKDSLRNLQQEHTLLINENGSFELVPWEQVENVAGAKAPGRAFSFERNGSVWAAYWHTSGQGWLELPVPARKMTLMRQLGKPLSIKGRGDKARLPVGELRYIRFSGVTRQDVIHAFQTATISA
jgi:hypothetical protein